MHMTNRMVDDIEVQEVKGHCNTSPMVVKCAQEGQTLLGPQSKLEKDWKK
jgi:hypothetical protein